MSSFTRSLSGLTLLSAAMMSPVTATIIVEGTPEEKQLIEDHIASLRTRSTLANTWFGEFDGSANVTIRCGESPFGGRADVANRVATIDKEFISCFKFIDPPGGPPGFARQSVDLDMIIAHEVLGHIRLGTMAEGRVLTAMNAIRREVGYVERIKYLTKVDGRLVSVFADESMLDFTDAMAKRTKKNGVSQTGVRLDTSSQVQVVGTLSPGGEMQFALDPASLGQTLDIDTTPLGGGIESVSLNDFSLALSGLTPSIDSPNTNIDSFSLGFGSFDLAGEETGLNFLDSDLDPHGGAGSWTFDGSLTDFSFDVGGLYGLTNDIYGLDEAFAGMALSGFMQYDAGQNAWFGTMDLQGVTVVGVPEPSTFLLLISGLIGVSATSRRRRIAA